jgi:hypothetical protein
MPGQWYTVNRLMVDRFVPARPGVYMIELGSAVIDAGRASNLRAHLSELLRARDNSGLARTLESGGLRLRIRYRELPPLDERKRQRGLRERFKHSHRLRAA